MIQRLTHANVYVLDHDSAKDFYVNKLGFEVRTDQMLGESFRWLTVAPKGQPDLEIILLKPEASPFLDEATAAKMRELPGGQSVV